MTNEARTIEQQVSEPPVTFEQLSYALFDPVKNAVMTTIHGNLAIFSTKAMAKVWALKGSPLIQVIPVQITRGTEQ